MAKQEPLVDYVMEVNSFRIFRFLLFLRLGISVLRISQFSETKFGFEYLGDGIHYQNVFSRLDCGILCCRTFFCRSYNFCDLHRCSLNKFDLEGEDESQGRILVENSSCVYVGIQSELEILCNKTRPESTVDRCGLLWKYGAEVKTWEEIVHSATEYKVTEVTACLSRDSVEVDSFYCSHISSAAVGSKVKLHYILGLTEKTWQQARSHCESIGGKLFEDIDGTQAQLDLIWDVFRTRPLWTGINDRKSEGKYVTSFGRDVTQKIIWGDNAQKETNQDDEDALVFGKAKFLDFKESRFEKFLCDLL